MDRNTDRGYRPQQLIGAIIALGGAWHAASPWIFGYANNRAAMISNVAGGLALVLFGGIRAATHGTGWANLICALVAVWILSAPVLLGFGGPGFAADEALWGGLIVLVLSGFGAIASRFGRSDVPAAATP